jgi:acetyl esterase
MDDPVVQRAFLKAVLTLPRPALRLLSGGGVVFKGGRTLDPRLQFLASQARGAPPLSTMTPQEARLASASALKMVEGGVEAGVGVETFTITTETGPVTVRAYRPVDQDPALPVMVYAHMGGGVIGDLGACHAFCSLIAATVRCPVLSVAYRLAPEHRFPAGLDDVLAVYRWTLANAGRFGAPTGAAAVGGDSMGGNFAAVICQELRRHGEAQPALQLLVYPAVDLASESPSMSVYADAYPLTRSLMEWFIGHYIGPGDDPSDPRLSPLRAADLSGLAPAVIATAGFDPLLDQGETYARRLKEAGTTVVYRCYDNLARGFGAFTGAVPAADVACRKIARLAREAMTGRSG